jgi:Na+/proline symporter
MIGYILENLPVGIIGLVVSGAFAAAMSSVDSLINSMTTVFVKDIYERYFYKGKGEASLKMSMTISAVIGVIVIFVVLFGFSGTVKSVLDVVGKYISYFSGPAAGSFLLAMFTMKANDKGVATGFIVGVPAVFWIAKLLGTSWLWNPAIGCLITFVVGYAVSLLFTSDKQVDDYKQFTAKGMREKMLAEGKATTEDGVSILPFQFDKYAIFALVFFVAQYIFIAMIQ